MEWKSTSTYRRPSVYKTIGGKEVLVAVLYTRNGIPCPSCNSSMRGFIESDEWFCPRCELKMGDCFIQWPKK